jgi:hypothetical protein
MDVEHAKFMLSTLRTILIWTTDEVSRVYSERVVLSLVLSHKCLTILWNNLWNNPAQISPNCPNFSRFSQAIALILCGRKRWLALMRPSL